MKYNWSQVRGLAVLSLEAFLVVAMASRAATARNQTNAIHRPIQDFVSAQGTFCFPKRGGGCLLFVPPISNFIGWTSTVAQNRAASVDYAGIEDAWVTAQSGGAIVFNTQFKGDVFEIPLPDGRAEVSVTLHTTHALTWVIVGDGSGNFDFANGPLLFGHRTQDVLSGEDAAFSNCLLHLRFINTAPGAPLPDLEQLAGFPQPGQVLEFVGFESDGSGDLRVAFGVADGTPGQAQVTQTGLLVSKGKGIASKGFFPVEHVDLMVVGQ
jgi:hypothetical protein